jgi:putative transcriptional regulator
MKAKAKKTRTGRYAAALAEAEAMKRGEQTGAKIHTPADIVKQLRTRLGLSQSQFSARFAIPVGTLRDWENGRRQPEGSALALLRVIAYAPETVAEALTDAA